MARREGICREGANGQVECPPCNQSDYYYHNGAFYSPVTTDAGFVVVAPLSGAIVPVIPTGHTSVTRAGTTYYYVGGVYYRPIRQNGRDVFVVVDL